MFYKVNTESLGGGEECYALACLTPPESKRLIGKGVAALPEVRRALEKGKVIIARGTTNAFVAEELLGIKIDKVRFAAGVITQGRLCITAPEGRINPFVIYRGEAVNIPPREALKDFDKDDAFIKGASALDEQGNAAVLVGNRMGGTVGESLAILAARGSYLIVPVGMEKMVPSVARAAPRTGITRFRYATGFPVGLVPLTGGMVVTEIQALEVLAGVKALHIASGGIGGSEGAVVLSIWGTEERVSRAFSLIESIKGEPPLPQPWALGEEV